MPTLPIMPGPIPQPKDQVATPAVPPKYIRDTEGVVRYPHAVSVIESYRQTVIRIWPAGPDGDAVDVVPDPDAQPVGPGVVFGEEVEAVHFLSGTHANGRLTTRDEDAASLEGLRSRLDYDGVDWRPAVATSLYRQWVEGGVLLLGFSDDDAQRQARYFGQDVVFRWDDRGLTPLASRLGADVGGDAPVAAAVVPARTGCPMRRGADDGPCKMYGGPWTSASITAAMSWRQHRALLIDAFGCSVCEGVDVRGITTAVGLYTPSREGGWQVALPLPPDQLDRS